MPVSFINILLRNAGVGTDKPVFVFNDNNTAFSEKREGVFEMSGIPYSYCPRCATPLLERLQGRTQRPVCPACGFIVYFEPKVVAVVVVEHQGQVLLGRRNIDPGKGLWSFCSGYVDRGERLEDAAVREVKEETNLDVRLEGLLGLYSASGNPHILVAYRATILQGSLEDMQAEPEEVSELRFFAPGAVPPLAFPFDPRILRDWCSVTDAH